MNIKRKKVLVTGSDGFIGSHLVEELVRLGCKVRAFVFYNSFNSWGWLEHLDPAVKDCIDVFMGDIRDYHGVRSAMNGCDVVFHLAALISIPFSYVSPDVYIDTNVKGTLNIVQAARELNVEKLVHTSTSEVYGSAQYVPINEIHPLQGQSPYAASKIGADQLVMSFFLSYGTPVTIIRPFNTYGPRQSNRAVIPTIITNIANGKKRLKLGALNPKRDFVYIKDTVQGFIALAESDNSVGEIINIGSNFSISINETVTLIAAMIGTHVEVVRDEQRIRPARSEVKSLWADNTKAMKLCGWKPEYTGREGFKRGIQKTIDWFSIPDNLNKYKADCYII